MWHRGKGGKVPGPLVCRGRQSQVAITLKGDGCSFRSRVGSELPARSRRLNPITRPLAYDPGLRNTRDLNPGLGPGWFPAGLGGEMYNPSRPVSLTNSQSRVLEPGRGAYGQGRNTHTAWQEEYAAPTAPPPVTATGVSFSGTQVNFLSETTELRPCLRGPPCECRRRLGCSLL